MMHVLAFEVGISECILWKHVMSRISDERIEIN